jgi:alpha-methylacyl-CoA racemase
MSGPLSGVRVVEIAGIGPGPYACMMLADLGADVVRVERPQQAARVDDEGLDPTLRSRRSIVLDLKQPAGVAVLLRLVDQSDALIEGFRPGVAERLGFGPEVCCVRNSRLVYGRMTGWGQRGPLARKAGHDINYLALSGLLHQIGPTDGKPVPPFNALGDLGGGGMLLAFGVVAALYERERSGRGQVIDAAILDGAASFANVCLGLAARGRWRDGPGASFLSGAAHFYDTYETHDGRWVAVGSIEPQFHALLIERLGLDPAEFAVGVGLEGAPHDELLDEIWPALKRKLAAAIRLKSRDELQALFEDTDACVTPVLDLDEAAAHRHQRERGTWVNVDGHRQSAPAPRFSRSQPDIPRAANPPGADTEAVLAELGFGVADVRALRGQGILG